MMRDNQKTLAPVLEYYKKTFMDFGATPKGVDWNGEKSQFLRFERILRNIQLTAGDSILDFGCGYGSLTNLLKAKDLELNSPRIKFIVARLFGPCTVKNETDTRTAPRRATTTT